MFIHQHRYTKANTVDRIIIIIIITILKKYQFPSAGWREGSCLTTASPGWCLTGEGRSTSSQAWRPGLSPLHNAKGITQNEQSHDEINDNVRSNTPQATLFTENEEVGKQKYSSSKEDPYQREYRRRSRLTSLLVVKTVRWSAWHSPFKQKIRICQHLCDFKRTLKGLLSQKKYLVYFINICSAATVSPLVPFWEYPLNL